MEWMKAWIKWDKGIPADRLYPLHPISPVFTREASSYDMIQYIPLVYSHPGDSATRLTWFQFVAETETSLSSGADSEQGASIMQRAHIHSSVMKRRMRVSDLCLNPNPPPSVDPILHVEHHSNVDLDTSSLTHGIKARG